MRTAPASIATLQLVLLLALGVSSSIFAAASKSQKEATAQTIKPAASMPSSHLVDFLLTSSSEGPQAPTALAALGSASPDAPPPIDLPLPEQPAPYTPASAAAAAAAVLPPPQSLDGQEDAVRGLLQRLLPAHEHLFVLQLGPQPSALVPTAAPQPAAPAYFALQVACGHVHVHGSSGVELAAGVHWFLKHWADCSLSWEATGGLQLNPEALSPGALAALEGRGRVVTERAVPLSFYQNVVTQSYSMAYWEWDRWERELDWMALQGINLPLAPVGMEAVWTTTFAQFGLDPASDLEDFFTGPSFLAWGRMGNIQGYGGPLPAAYMAKQAALQQQIVTRMRQYGMTPVFPAFAGFIPRALGARYPHAQATPASNWCRFPHAYCCPYLLDPRDPLFAQIGAAFIRNLRAAYGQDPRGYYIADTFNEMRPASADPGYLGASSAAVYAAMQAADAGAVWVMQAWLFFSDQHFWHASQIKALLGGVPPGCLLLLDLFAEEHAVWRRTEAFYGTPFVWTMLHNFGGNLELYGALPSIVSGVAAAIAEAPNCVGIGMAPEGIEQNPVVYEAMAEMAFRGGRNSSGSGSNSNCGSGSSCDDNARNNSSDGTSSKLLDVAEWAQAYSRRRYAGAAAAQQVPTATSDAAAAAQQLPPSALSALERAWTLLARSVYSCSDHMRSTVADIPTSRPGFSRSEITGWGLGPHMWYDVHDLMSAWDALLVAVAEAPGLGCSSAFVYDLVDVGRELMSKLSGEFWGQVVGAYGAKDQGGLFRAGELLGGLLGDMDALLGSHKGFMLGPYMARALAYAASGDAELGLGGDAMALQSVIEGAWATARAAEGSSAAMGGSSNSSSTSINMSRSSSGASSAGSGGSVSMSSGGTSRGSGGCDDVAPLVPHGAVAAVAQMEQREHLEALYEWNARTQLTIWGTSNAAGDSEVSDYANKEWSGLISSFYAPRWRLWLNSLHQDLALNRPYDAEAWRLQCLTFTYEWVGRRDGSSFPTAPKGDAVALSRAAFNKYVPIVLSAIAGHRANAAAAAAAAAAES